MKEALSVYFVVGEVSGDALGADLIENFRDMDVAIQTLGLGGPKMVDHGLEPLFDPSEIAIMGISGVVTRMPAILKRAREVAADILDKKPDVLLLIDSPEFAKLVAKRVKAKNPAQKVVKYVCPSVWSWRPSRAPAMRSYIDQVLAILPFEAEVMRELGGPETIYVGHPLSRLAGTVDLTKKRAVKSPPTIMLLPGSRRSEISRLMPILEKTVEILEDRGAGGRYQLPAVSHLEAKIRETTAQWKHRPQILIGEAAKVDAMKQAEAAIAASGTALLELAMYGVPMVSIYKPDPALNAIGRFLIKAWTGALPNLIADKVIVPERFNEFAHPGYIARLIEDLIEKGPARETQLAGFETLHDKIRVDVSPGRRSAEIILRLAETKRASEKT